MLKFLLTLSAKRRIAMGPVGLRKFVILRHDFFGSDSKLMELQNFSQLKSILDLFWS